MLQFSFYFKIYLIIIYFLDYDYYFRFFHERKNEVYETKEAWKKEEETIFKLDINERKIKSKT